MNKPHLSFRGRRKPETPSRDRQLQFLLDALVLLAGYAISYLVRFDFVLTEILLRPVFHQAPLMLLMQLAAAARCGIYSFVWRYVGLAEIRPFAQAALLVVVPLAVMRFALPDALAMLRVPLSIILLSQVFGFGGMLAVRVLRRLVWEAGGVSPARRNRRPTVIIGAGRAGAAVARELRNAQDSRLVGLLDDDPEKRHLAIHGVRVLGNLEALPTIIEQFDIGLVVVAIRQTPRALMRGLIETCKSHGVAVRVVPSLQEILSGETKQTFRAVEIEDLLGREPVELDLEAMRRFLSDRVVLVSGAGGSIGAEICRQVSTYSPASLLLVERAEFALFEIHRELAKNHPDMAIEPIVADIGDGNRIQQILQQHRPEVVVHAAAHKHVALMEKNCTEAVKNNILATRTFAECCAEAGADIFIQISTDKAVQPTSIMGSSKRVAEWVVQSLNDRSDTRFVAVRFGNVMGSAGSVVPIFREQIEEGGPLTVTHPDMVRYFMTIPEAAQLVLQAGALSKGGEIMVLDMGAPVRILDLAEDMIRLSGYRPYEDIDICFTGPSRGEKLSEQLQNEAEALLPTLHPKILIGRILDPPADFPERLDRLALIASGGREGELRRALAEILEPDSQTELLRSQQALESKAEQLPS